MISLCVDFVVGYLFVHDCLWHGFSFSCMTALRLSLGDTFVSPYIQITSLGQLLIIDFLGLGVILNCLPSTKLGIWSKV